MSGSSAPDSSQGSSLSQTLFNDGLISIFRRLSLRDLIHASRTCQHWSRVSQKSGIPYHLMKCEFHADDKILQVPDEYQPKYHLIQLAHVPKKKSSNDANQSNANELMQLSAGNISVLFTQLPSLMNLACQLLQSDHKLHSAFATAAASSTTAAAAAAHPTATSFSNRGNVSAADSSSLIVGSSSTLHLIWPSTLTYLTIDFGRIELPQVSPIWTALGDARNLIQLKILQFKPVSMQPHEFTHLQQLTHLTSFTFTLIAGPATPDVYVDWYEIFTVDQLKQLRELNFCDGMCINFNRLAPTVNRLSRMQYFHVDRSYFHPTALDQLHTIMPNLRILKSNHWYLDDLPLLTYFIYLHTLGLGGVNEDFSSMRDKSSLIHRTLLALPQLTTLLIDAVDYPIACWSSVASGDSKPPYLPILSSLTIGPPYPSNSTSRAVYTTYQLTWPVIEAIQFALLFQTSLTHLSIHTNYADCHEVLPNLKRLTCLRQLFLSQHCDYDMIQYQNADVIWIDHISGLLRTLSYQLKSLVHYVYEVYGDGAQHFEEYHRPAAVAAVAKLANTKSSKSVSPSPIRLVSLEPTTEVPPAPRLVGIELNPGPNRGPEMWEYGLRCYTNLSINTRCSYVVPSSIGTSVDKPSMQSLFPDLIHSPYLSPYPVLIQPIDCKGRRSSHSEDQRNGYVIVEDQSMKPQSTTFTSITTITSEEQMIPAAELRPVHPIITADYQRLFKDGLRTIFACLTFQELHSSITQVCHNWSNTFRSSPCFTDFRDQMHGACAALIDVQLHLLDAVQGDLLCHMRSALIVKASRDIITHLIGVNLLDEARSLTAEWRRLNPHKKEKKQQQQGDSTFLKRYASLINTCCRILGPRCMEIAVLCFDTTRDVAWVYTPMGISTYFRDQTKKEVRPAKVMKQRRLQQLCIEEFEAIVKHWRTRASNNTFLMQLEKALHLMRNHLPVEVGGEDIPKQTIRIPVIDFFVASLMVEFINFTFTPFRACAVRRIQINSKRTASLNKILVVYFKHNLETGHIEPIELTAAEKKLPVVFYQGWSKFDHDQLDDDVHSRCNDTYLAAFKQRFGEIYLRYLAQHRSYAQHVKGVDDTEQLLEKICRPSQGAGGDDHILTDFSFNPYSTQKVSLLDLWRRAHVKVKNLGAVSPSL